jgi:hypothetical protein
MIDPRETENQVAPTEPATSEPQPSQRRLSTWILSGGLTILLLAGGIAGGWLIGVFGKSEASKNVQFPDWVYVSSLSLDSYKAAVQLGDSLRHLPCYCGCVETSHHTSLHDCFYKKDGSFDDHASACDVCGQEAMDALAWQKGGSNLKEIRKQIDVKYKDYGTPTNTP